MNKTKKIILASLLLAILIIFGRFISIKTPILVISLSFLPIILSAILLGPKYSCLIAALGDLIGALLFPFGEYFVGFTIFQGIVGLVYGLFLYNKNENQFFKGKSLLIRLTLSSLIVLGIIELPCMSLMLHFLYGNAFIAILGTRIITKAFMLPIQVITIYFLNPYIIKLSDKYLFTEE